jgi:hypothetical protein
MSQFPRKTPWRVVSLALLPLLLGSQGCRSWQVQDPPIAPHVERGPDVVRLTLVDGRRLELLRPSVRNDSIVGTPYGVPRSPGGVPAAASPAVALADIVRIEVRKTDRTRTLSGLLGGGGALLLLRLVAAPSSTGLA